MLRKDASNKGINLRGDFARQSVDELLYGTADPADQPADIANPLPDRV